MLNTVIAMLIVYLLLMPLAYALWPKSFEFVMQTYMTYVRWFGKGVRRFLAGLFQ